MILPAKFLKISNWIWISNLSNVEKITSAILPWASNILFTHLPFRLFSNLFSVTMLALLLRISSKIAQKCRCKIAELILSTLHKLVVLKSSSNEATASSNRFFSERHDHQQSPHHEQRIRQPPSLRQGYEIPRRLRPRSPREL